MKQDKGIDLWVANQKLALKAMQTLTKQNLKIGIAESCTGGLLSYHFTALSGASEVLDGAMISYANIIKSTWLNVSTVHLADFGAVSEPVVRDMCDGILKATNANIALATSGIAGPNGGTISKPVGTVFIGVKKHHHSADVVLCHFSGERNIVQLKACKKALEMLNALLDS